jgi:translation elongation factor EF-Ts
MLSITDFVSRNKEFQSFVALVASTANSMDVVGEVSVTDLLNKSPASAGNISSQAATLNEALGDVVTAIREKIVIRRATNLKVAAPGGVIGSYVHGKVGTDILPAHIQVSFGM